MSEPSPQSYSNRRRYPRAKVIMNVDWGETPACEHGGQITSLSVGGCFVLTTRRIAQGKAVFVRLMLAPGSDSILEGVVLGRVAYHLANVGFGVEFKTLPDEYRNHIQDIVDFYLGSQEEA